MDRISGKRCSRLVYVILGTKGQYIKMAGVLKLLEERKLPFLLIHTGQHTQIIEEIRKIFNLRAYDWILDKREKDLSSILECANWFKRCIFKAIIYKRAIFSKPGIILTHGDTESTLLSVLLSRIFSLPLFHVESGLRSTTWKEPFPEEIIRRITSRFGKALFAPGDWAVKNLKRVRRNINFSCYSHNFIY